MWSTRRMSMPWRAAPSRDDVVAVEARLRNARRPLVIAGGSRWDAAARDALLRFAEASRLPVACAFRHQDLFDNRHPNYAGDVGIGINPKLRGPRARRRCAARHRRAARGNDDIGLFAARCSNAYAGADSRSSRGRRIRSRLPARDRDCRDAWRIPRPRSTVRRRVRWTPTGRQRARTTTTSGGERRATSRARWICGRWSAGSTSVCRKMPC